jgi:hypothetical protein
MDGPFRDYPQITVYHPTDPADGHPFANVGYSGFIGSFSGMSSVPMGTSEIGVSYPDSTFGRESREGIPFTYLLRDILQFDNKLQDSIDRITNANRTCDLILGVGDGTQGHDVAGFRGIEYSYSTALFFDDTDMMPEADWHPRMTDVVYYGMDWNCPNYDIVLNNQLVAGYGAITPEYGILNITSIVQTGDNFVTYYDLTPSHPTMHVSFAGSHDADSQETSAKAYDRLFAKIDMAKLFAVSPPTPEEIEATKDVKWDAREIRSGRKFFTATS